METKELVDELLRLLEILTAAPVVVFLLTVLFRREIRSFLPQLGSRLTSAEIAGTRFEFSAMAVNALQEAIEKGAEAYKDKPEELVGFVRDQVKKLPEIQGMSATTGQPSLGGRSILWVDDNPLNNIYETSLLNRLGASVVTARSTTEALELLKRRSFDLIISDIGRVEEGRPHREAGYELLQALDVKKHPVVFYTTRAGVEKTNAKIRTAFGVTDNPSELIDIVTRALGR